MALEVHYKAAKIFSEKKKKSLMTNKQQNHSKIGVLGFVFRYYFIKKIHFTEIFWKHPWPF